MPSTTRLARATHAPVTLAALAAGLLLSLARHWAADLAWLSQRTGAAPHKVTAPYTGRAAAHAGRSAAAAAASHHARALSFRPAASPALSRWRARAPVAAAPRFWLL